MPEKIKLDDPDPTDDDLEWFRDQMDQSDALEGEAFTEWFCHDLTARERERFMQCALHYTQLVAETPSAFPLEIQAQLAELQEASRKLLDEMRARGMLQIIEGEDGIEYELKLPH